VEFELQPTLRGSQITLRPLYETDFDALFAAASDPLIWQQHPEADRYQRDVFQKFFDSGLASGGAFVVLDAGSGRIVGSSRYYDYRPDQKEVKIGYTFLERACWGGDYNRELKSLMVDHAFRFVDRVLFEVGEHNLRSQKALEKIGARYSTRVESVAPDGSIRVNFIFVLERPPVHPFESLR
jgi:RimJ/RimL family protein N-acetyltransferase